MHKMWATSWISPSRTNDCYKEFHKYGGRYQLPIPAPHHPRVPCVITQPSSEEHVAFFKRNISVDRFSPFSQQGYHSYYTLVMQESSVAQRYNPSSSRNETRYFSRPALPFPYPPPLWVTKWQPLCYTGFCLWGEDNHSNWSKHDTV